MTTAHAGDGALLPELEAIAAAAHDRLHAQAGEDLSAAQEAQRRVGETARAAITAGAPSPRSPTRSGAVSCAHGKR
jgi:hypothetical protein